MDDLKRIEGKTIKSIERDYDGENSFLIIKFKEGGKVNVVSHPNGDGVGQLEVVAEGIKLEDSVGKRIQSAIEEFDGENDFLILNLKGGGKVSINSFGSSETSNAKLSVDVYLESKKIVERMLVSESINEYYGDNGDDGDDPRQEALDQAKQEAYDISVAEDCAQHVNEIKPGVYKVEDWYDSDITVASFESGQQI